MKLHPAPRTTNVPHNQPNRSLTARFRTAIPRTKAGHIKGRLTWDEKVRVLDPFSDRKATEARLDQFQELFGFWRKLPALTYTSEENLGCWFTRKKGLLYLEDVARHLTADRLYPALNPQWVAPRSGAKTTFFCVDVDLRVYPGDMPAIRKVAVQDFEHRCRLVEETLGLMDVDASNPRQVLVQQTPSGGRHYYVFLDAVYHTDTIANALGEMGLRHTPGKIEVYPRENRCLRLPFGHVPGQPHDPTRWIQFIDDYANRKIIRFSLQELTDSHSVRTRQARSPRSAPSPQPQPSETTRPVRIVGVPKRLKLTPTAPLEGQDPDARYAALQREGIRSTQDAQELIRLGVRSYGTRHWALKQLAIHLVWFQKLRARQAAAEITTWAMNPRHMSRTIQRDLATGRGETTRQIIDLCKWCEVRNRGTGVSSQESARTYSREELSHLCAVLNDHSGPDRRTQAQFYLRFLWFAKRHGTPAEDRSGWEAAPAVRPIIRSWPGCSHMHYKTRMTAAEQAGVFRMVREKKQTPNGTGRARTYRLTVPVSHPSEWVIPEDEALKWLETAIPVDHPQEPEAREVIPEANHQPKEYDDVFESGPNAARNAKYSRRSDRCHGRRAHTSSVPATSAGEHLDQGPRERPAEWDAAPDLLGLLDVHVDPTPEPAEEPCDEPELIPVRCLNSQAASEEPPSRNVRGPEDAEETRSDPSVVAGQPTAAGSRSPEVLDSDLPVPSPSQSDPPREESGTVADHEQTRAAEVFGIENDLLVRPDTPSFIRGLLVADRTALTIEQVQLIGWAVGNERRRRRGERMTPPG